MIAYAHGGTVRIADDPLTLNFHLALRYGDRAEETLRSMLGEQPPAGRKVVAAFDLLRKKGSCSPADVLRQAVNLVISKMQALDADYVLGEWQCLLTAVILFREKEPDFLEAFLRDLAEQLSSLTENKVLCTTSVLFSAYEHLPAAAEEALEANRYAGYLTAEPDVIAPLYQQIPGAAGGRAEEKPQFAAYVQRFRRMITTGAEEAQVRKLSRQCADAMITGLPRVSAVHFSVIAFCGELERVMTESNVIGNPYITGMQMIPDLLHAENEAKFRQILEDRMKQILLYSNQLRYSRFADSVTAAMRYIEEHITDPELSAAGVADWVQVSQTALSAQFRKFYGESMQSLIHRKRIARIREQISSTNRPIRELAQENGYISLATLNRAFLKYEGTYPGALRKKNTQAKREP